MSAARVHGPKPPTPQRVSIEALLDGQCGYAVVRSRKSLSGKGIFSDLTLLWCAVTCPRRQVLTGRQDLQGRSTPRGVT